MSTQLNSQQYSLLAYINKTYEEKQQIWQRTQSCILFYNTFILGNIYCYLIHWPNTNTGIYIKYILPPPHWCHHCCVTSDNCSLSVEMVWKTWMQFKRWLSLPSSSFTPWETFFWFIPALSLSPASGFPPLIITQLERASAGQDSDLLLRAARHI